MPKPPNTIPPITLAKKFDKNCSIANRVMPIKNRHGGGGGTRTHKGLFRPLRFSKPLPYHSEHPSRIQLLHSTRLKVFFQMFWIMNTYPLATTSATTFSAPFCFRAFAHSFSVAPDVQTSSISRTVRPRSPSEAVQRMAPETFFNLCPISGMPACGEVCLLRERTSFLISRRN